MAATLISMPSLARDNNPAELRAFDATCERLADFDPGLSFEWIDGYLTALAAGPQLPAIEEWLAAMCGDAFERAFADPADHAQALRALKTRLVVLQDQLDPEALHERPEVLRLAPLMSQWSDDDRAHGVAQGELTAAQAQQLQTGALWAQGFLDAVKDFAAIWPRPVDDDEAAEFFTTLLAQIEALLAPAGSPPMQAHLARFFPDRAPPSRDDLIEEAGFAVQEFRVWWVDRAPRPETRRVQKAPGRNDPCPCGSGKKFKKCHGAAAA